LIKIYISLSVEPLWAQATGRVKQLSRLWGRLSHFNIWNPVKLIGLSLVIITLLLPIKVVSATASVPVALAAPVALYTQTPELQSLTASIVETSAPRVNIQVVTSVYQQENRARQTKVVKLASQLTVPATPDPSLEEKRAWVKKAASAFSINWKVLEAVWQIESGKAWKTSTISVAGATGPCQFMPGTWAKYATDGDGDGVSDITDARDCLFGAAKLLAANGAASGDNVRALLSYNHSLSYVAEVMAIADSIGS
jgi:membrane-bound lytic murein transglycosylase B